MAYYIRRKNDVYRERDLVLGDKWSQINSTTSQLQVLAFTTRNDANQFIKKYDIVDAVVSNNLDYEL